MTDQNLPYSEKGSKIPLIIMQTWKSKKLPRHWQESQKSIKKKMPTWTYVLMTDQDNRNFVEKHFPEYLHTYDNFLYPIQRVDMIRPMWLYIHGGVYMDLDYVVQKDFSELFKDGKDLYFVSSPNINSIITNSFIASIPKHPFWLEYLQHMKEDPPFWALTKHFHVMTTTGPMALTKKIGETKYVYSLLPQSQLIPCDVCNIGHCSPDGYLKTIIGQSWNGWDSTFLNFLHCNRSVILVSLLILFILFCLWRIRIQ